MESRMAITDGTEPQVGDRVQLHPATDAWMQGDRFGVVESVMAGPGIRAYRVRLDSGRLRRFAPSSLLAIVR